MRCRHFTLKPSSTPTNWMWQPLHGWVSAPLRYREFNVHKYRHKRCENVQLSFFRNMFQRGVEEKRVTVWPTGVAMLVRHRIRKGKRKSGCRSGKDNRLSSCPFLLHRKVFFDQSCQCVLLCSFSVCAVPSASSCVVKTIVCWFWAKFLFGIVNITPRGLKK